MYHFNEGLEEEDDRFVIPAVHEVLTPLVAVIPFQLISYYAALHRECDVDKPRNLLKLLRLSKIGMNAM